MENIFENIGKNLKYLRQDKNLAQNDVAKLLNMSQSNYSRCELGKRSIDIADLCKLADFYGVSLDFIVGR